MDLDGDGVIDYREFHSMMSSMNDIMGWKRLYVWSDGLTIISNMMSSMSDMIWFLVCTVWRANNHSAIFTHMSYVLFYSVIMHHICSNYRGFIPSVKVFKQISVVFSCSEKRGSSMHVFVHMTCTTCPRACAHVFSYQLLWYSIVRVRFILVYIHFLE